MINVNTNVRTDSGSAISPERRDERDNHPVVVGHAANHVATASL
jgi:hypothetical protein